MTIDELARRPETPEAAQPGDLIVMNWEEGYHNIPILRGLRVWPGYVGLPPALRLRYSEVGAKLAGAKWNVTEAGIEPIQGTAYCARLLTDVKVSTSVLTDVQAINILERALVDESIGDLSGPSGSVRVLEDRPGRIVVETITPGRQLLIVTERFDAGWHVTDDMIGGDPAVSKNVGSAPACGWRFHGLRRRSRHTSGDVPLQACELRARLVGYCLWSPRCLVRGALCAPWDALEGVPYNYWSVRPIPELCSRAKLTN